VPFPIRNIGIDTNDLDRAERFWSAATGFVRKASIEHYVLLGDPSGGGPNLLLQEVPEPRAGKNRLHLDLDAPDADAAAAELVALGATRLRRFDQPGDTWVVLTDPDGNEFCICQSEPKIPAPG
jgi:catechol 2,3-dioxygenase-like lactoylglutathione lyase family enzyme